LLVYVCPDHSATWETKSVGVFGSGRSALSTIAPVLTSKSSGASPLPNCETSALDSVASRGSRVLVVEEARRIRDDAHEGGHLEDRLIGAIHRARGLPPEPNLDLRAILLGVREEALDEGGRRRILLRRLLLVAVEARARRPRGSPP